jgi:hypothetical protein
MVRHPCDPKAWRYFHDNVDPTFYNDAWNIHFALVVDGVNTFKQTRSSWSTWPVMLLNYNLPPLVMHKEVFCIVGPLNSGEGLSYF